MQGVSLPLFPSEPLTFSRILERRRDSVSSQLEEVCRQYEYPRILSLANGAMREAESVLPLLRSAGGRILVLDATGEPPDLFRFDPDCKLVRYISYPYGFIPSSDNIGEFHFIYSLNMLGELSQGQALSLISNLVALLRPGGRLLLSSLTSEAGEVRARGIFRSELDLAHLVPERHIQKILGHTIWRDESGGVIYLEIQKDFCGESAIC